MKTLKISVASLAVLIAVGILFGSCRKKTAETDDDTTEANDHTTAENASNDIINIGSQATDNNSSGLTANKGTSTEGTLSYCATIKHDSIHKIDSVIFNNSNCLDGKVRNGILIFDYSQSTNGAKHYRNPGFKCSVKSVGYSVEGKAINIIDKTIENTTPIGFEAPISNLTWKITGHIQVTKANGTHDFTFTRYKTLLNSNDANVYHGQSVPITWTLAKVGITGNASGTTAKGNSYSMTITSELIRDFGGCSIGKKHPFIQGKLEFTPGKKATRFVDFGNGTCDDEATVTIKGITRTITLN